MTRSADVLGITPAATTSRRERKVTDTLHALFHRTWLLHCDICEDRVRLPCPDTHDRDEWQAFINAWKAVHHGHVYLDSAPNGLPGPVTTSGAGAVLTECEETAGDNS